MQKGEGIFPFSSQGIVKSFFGSLFPGYFCSNIPGYGKKFRPADGERGIDIQLPFLCSKEGEIPGCLDQVVNTSRFPGKITQIGDRGGELIGKVKREEGMNTHFAEEVQCPVVSN